MKALPEIEAEINRLAAKVGASGHVLPTYGRTEDGARPHIEADARGYHYVVVERGQELRRNTTPDLDDLLYHVFESVTFSLACDYELAHRVAGQDFRRVLFARQIELLSSLSPSWAGRESLDHQRILQQHPFVDP
ncbi:MAG: Imm63 family immunity protein [Chthoniobacter sp.]|nr:Imm63 family immunity protein [Chthoniobacter sp.]